ncbi:MAG: 7-carboxy-7-deazaguanine synthase QueE [Polyangiaceae bacterium]|nr:7-carboxy-7-deazaguanine synthase QueE [Polyangiaceae bacterium]
MAPDPARVRTLTVSEAFESIQGEGPSAGAPSAFLRLAACNLRCRWCDTRHSWDFRLYRYRDQARRVGVEQLAGRLRQMTSRRIVVTGGEPLLQARGLAALLERLGPTWTVEVESNATILPGAELSPYVHQWNLSPKLSNSGESEPRRLRREVLAWFRGLATAYLKLVVVSAADLDEADELVSSFDWPRERVWLMPCARTRAELRARSRELVAHCIERGYRLSPRLQLELFEGERGR